MQDRTAYPAHPVAIFCPVLVCPQKAIMTIKFVAYFLLSPHQIDLKKLSHVLKNFSCISPWTLETYRDKEELDQSWLTFLSQTNLTFQSIASLGVYTYCPTCLCTNIMPEGKSITKVLFLLLFCFVGKSSLHPNI